MAKGSGLFIDSSSSSSDRIQFCFDHNHPSQTPLHIINSLPYHHPKLKMESESNAQELSTIQFTVSPRVDIAPGPSDRRRQRMVINEVDFFASNGTNNNNNNSNSNKDDRSSDVVTSAENKGGVIEVNTRLHLLTANAGSDQSTVDDGISPNSEGKKSAKSPELGTLEAEVERINRENQQLRDMLNQVTNNYNALQMHLITFMQQQQEEKHHDCNSIPEHDNKEEYNEGDDKSKSPPSIIRRGEKAPRKFMDMGLSDNCNNPNTLSDSNDNNEVQGDILDQGQRWVPNKAPRFLEPSSKENGNSSVDQAAEATMRKARVSVRARSEAPMISDGCQWRKYGQKMAKGNPCPRAYYRCTMAAGCPVRKQVQRCAEDRTILITTYEGTHSHPLPPAAMTMASATASAARMLLSGSMPSPDGTGLINPPNFLAYTRSLFPCSSSSVATISASAPFPTVTLDLTQTPNLTSSNNPLQQLFQRPPQPSHFQVPLLYNQSRFSGLQVSSQDNNNINNDNNNNNNQLADTVTALTTDPNFTAALAAAITSLMGNGGANNSTNHTASATSDSNGNNTNSHENTSNGS